LAPADFDDRMAVLSPHVFEGVPLTQAAERLVRRIMHRLDPGLVALAHHDPDVHRDEFELVLRRESVAAKEMWPADHTELDLLVLDEHGKRARPWLTVVLDDHSRAVAHYPVFFGAPT
jgi:putative transposase